MHVFFDTNILLDIATRKSDFPDSFEVYEHCIEKGYSCFISWHTLSTISYLLAKTVGHDQSNLFLQALLDTCQVASVGHDDALVAFDYDNGDLEDALQIASALSCEASLIISRDGGRGFQKCPLPVSLPTEFLTA